MNRKTTFRVVDNSFISGTSRVFDIASTRNKRVYIKSASPEESDRKAICSDWYITGKDIWRAYDQFKEKVKKQV